MADIAVEPLLSRLAVLGDLVMDPSMAAWRKSTFCNGADTCVEAALLPDGSVAVRDGKDPAGPVLAVSGADWCAFLERVKSWPAWPGGLVQAVRVRDGWWWMWLTSDATTRLQFTEAEMAAFWRGVHAHEFDLATLTAGVDGRSEGASAVLPDFGGGSVPA